MSGSEYGYGLAIAFAAAFVVAGFLAYREIRARRLSNQAENTAPPTIHLPGDGFAPKK
jgi:hypothetical protein